MRTHSSVTMYFFTSSLSTVAWTLVFVVQSVAQQVDFATKDYVPPFLKSLQLSALPSSSDAFKPIVNERPWHPSTSCKPLLDAINAVRPGSALRPFLTADGPEFATMASPLYSVGSATPLNPARRVLVSASNDLVPGEGMRVLVHWHGRGGTTVSRQELDNMSATYSALRNTLVLAPTSAIGFDRFEWHLTTSDGMADVWLMDDLVACLGKSDRVDATRIFISGMSAGAVHVSALAMLRPHYLAAAVSFSGGIVRLPLAIQNATVPSADALGGTPVPRDHAYAQLMPRTTPMLAIAGGPTDTAPFSRVQFPIATDRLHRLIWTYYTALTLTAPGIKPPALVRCDHAQGHRVWMGPEAVGPFLMDQSRAFKVVEAPSADSLLRGMVASGDAGTCRVVGTAEAAGVNENEIKAIVEQMSQAQGVGVGDLAGTAPGRSPGTGNGGDVGPGELKVSARLAMVGLLAIGGLV